MFVLEHNNHMRIVQAADLKFSLKIVVSKRYH